MPFYEFEDEAGQRFEVYLEMREAPEIGKWHTIGGKRLLRLPSVPEAHQPNFECVVRSQPRWSPEFPRTNARGQGVILNKREHQEYKAKTGLEWD